MYVRARHLLATAGLLAGGLSATALLTSPAVADDGGRPLSAALTGAAEVPGPGDVEGSGTAAVRVNPGRGQVCFELTVEGIAPATAAHIHEGSVDEAGPVVVGLTAPTSGTSEDCVDVSRALAREIIKNPSDYYVNVHNAEFKAGALRGQLSR